DATVAKLLPSAESWMAKVTVALPSASASSPTVNTMSKRSCRPVLGLGCPKSITLVEAAVAVTAWSLDTLRKWSMIMVSISLTAPAHAGADGVLGDDAGFGVQK